MSMIIDHVTFKVNSEDEASFLKEMEEMKAFLVENNFLPNSLKLLKDVNRGVYLLELTFNDSDSFWNWEESLLKHPEYPEFDRKNPIRNSKYSPSFLFVEEIQF